MKIKYFFSSAAVFLAAAILFFASLMFVQALDARAETVINPQIIDRIESAEKPDISFLTT